MIIDYCRVCHIKNPIGFALGTPVFSWLYTERDHEEIRESRLTVKNGAETVYDSGWDELDYRHTEAEIKLQPRTRYTWTVSVRTGMGEITSGVNCFETGKMDEPWQAKWITCDSEETRHPVFSKEIMISREVKKARLYICGLGLYEACYNGRKIGSEYLTPYCNNYNQWLQAQTYDVTDEMKESGILEVHLGNGWYKGRFGFVTANTSLYGSSWQLIAEVHIDYTDGSHEVIITDDTWKIRRSVITFSNIYDGEHRDDTLPDLPEESCTLSEGMRMPSDRYSLPVTAHETFVPELLHTPAGETVYDLKQNIAGIFTMRVHEPAGTVIRLQAGEVLQNGCFYRDNLRTALAEYVYVSDGKEHVIRPMFTFYGYRYMKVEGIRDPKPEDFAGIALYSDIENISELKTDNEKINRLILNSEWGMKGNFLDVPTDCPQRDERMGWTGDAQVFSATAMYFADTYAFYRKFLHDMGTEQAKYDGLVPLVIPSFGMAENSPMGSTASVWGDAATIIPWNVYLFSGDRSILEEQYPSMKAWVDYIQRTDGENENWRRRFQFGDWLALDGADRADAVMGGTDETYVADVYYRRSAQIVSDAAAILGKEDDSAKYAELAEKIRKRIERDFFTPSGRCAVMTQTGMILSIDQKLGNTEKSAEILAKLLDNNNRKLKTGFVGTPLFCPALTSIGRDDLAYDLLLNEEYPGWLYEVNLGATTIWERWNSMNPDGSVSSTGMNSFNHYSYGSIVQWIYERCAGIVSLKPGFSKVRIAPVPHRKLGSVDMKMRTVSGIYQISWSLSGRKTLHLSVTVPYGCEAELILPGKKEESTSCLREGTYVFDYEMSNVLGLLSADSSVGELISDPEIFALLNEKLPPVGSSTYSAVRGMDFRTFARRLGISDDMVNEIDEAVSEISLHR